MLEDNTYATSIYIAAPPAEVTAYVKNGMCLNEWTLGSRMGEQIDETTWLGSASGYQRKLYYHARHRDLGGFQIVEWHCGFEVGVYHHVYPMLLFPAAYFGSAEPGTYFHWISFVDPARRTPQIRQGLPTVHNAEARSLKANLERRHGHRQAVTATRELRAHTLYVDAPPDLAATYLGDRATIAEWGYMLRADGSRFLDEYDRSLDVELVTHALPGYHVIEHDSHYESSAIRTPLLLIPATYAFAQPRAPGLILHRISGWALDGTRRIGKLTTDDYNAEAINAKRILEAKAGNLESFARGNSYLGVPDA